MPSKDASIAAQTAAKAAADLYHGTADPDGMLVAMERIFNAIVDLGGDPDEFAQAERNLRAAGVEHETARDLSSEEGRWRDALIDNPDDWWDNVGDERATSGGGKGPDFKFKDEDANVKPLFLYGKYPAPEWVYEHLGLEPPKRRSNGGRGGGGQRSRSNGGSKPVPW